MEQVKFTRKEFNNLVWTETMTSISKKYKISNGRIRKICRDYNILLPNPGYWASVRYFKSTSVGELNKDFSGDDIISIHDNVTIEKYLTPTQIRQNEIESCMNLKLEANQISQKNDPLILLFKNNYFEKRKKYSNNEFFYYDEVILNVSEKLLMQALDFMNNLIQIFHERNHVIKIMNNNIYVTVFDVSTRIRIREKQKKIEIPSNFGWKLYEYKLSGHLAFQVDLSNDSRDRRFVPNREWLNSKTDLKSKISNIVATIEIEIEKKKLENEVHRKNQELAELKKKQETEYKERQESELLKFKKLLKDSKRWKEIIILREYIQTIERSIPNLPSNTEFNEDWIKWAKSKTDWYDPTLNQPDEMLDAFDKYEI